MSQKIIFILIGQKGSGKTFIGSLFDNYFQVPFLGVEDYAKKVIKDRAINDDSYLKEVFEVIENAVRNTLTDSDSLVFESTGLTDYFDNMLMNLNNDFKVVTIKVIADRDLCIKRVRSRDQSIHINISDKYLNEINSAVEKKKWVADFEIENTNKSLDELKLEIEKIIKKSFVFNGPSV